VSPILGSFLGQPLHAYGTFLGLSFAAGWVVALLEAMRRKLPTERVAGCFIIAGVLALVMSRVLWLLTNPGAQQAAVGTQGLVAYGGFIGGTMGVVIGARLLHVPLLAWADCAAPATAVGLAITRIGCFFNGCCWGKPTEMPWGVHFPHVDGVVHPTQLYEAFGGLLIVVPATFYASHKLRPGTAPLVFFATYAPLRFLIEVLRDDPDRGGFGPFSTSQWIAIVSASMALVLLRLLHRTPLPAAAAPAVSATDATAGAAADGTPKKKRRKKR
jgi:phosphatidylglycerol:prolipoprotein diacylglycerol transferase